MRFVLDCDDCILDFCGPVAKLAGIQKSDIRNRDLALLPGCKAWQRVLGTQSFWTALEPLSGAVDFVRAAAGAGHRVTVATSPWPGMGSGRFAEARVEALARAGLFYGQDYDALVLARYKGDVAGDVFCDDYAKNCEEWARANPTGSVYLHDSSSNQLESRFQRINSLTELMPLISKESAR